MSVTGRLVAPFQRKRITKSPWSAFSKRHIVSSQFTARHKPELLKYGGSAVAVHSVWRFAWRRRRDNRYGLHWFESPTPGRLPRRLHCRGDSITWVDRHWTQNPEVGSAWRDSSRRSVSTRVKLQFEVTWNKQSKVKGNIVRARVCVWTN